MNVDLSLGYITPPGKEEENALAHILNTLGENIGKETFIFCQTHFC